MSDAHDRGQRPSREPPRHHHRPPVTRRFAASATVAVALVALLLGLSIWLRPIGVERFTESIPIAESFLEEEGQAWPPAEQSTMPVSPKDVETEDEAAEDAGAREPPPADAGPPLVEIPPERPGFRARAGRENGFYYIEAVLGDASFDDPLPMVVVFHGRASRAHIPGGPFRDLSHPVRVIAPQATDPLGDGWTWLPVYVGQGLVDRLAATLFEMASRLAKLVRDLTIEHETLGKPIVTGFSQGGILTLALAVHHDDIVGAAFPIAGWLPPPLEPTYRRSDLAFPRIRAMHGTEDRRVPIEPTRELFDRLDELGFDVALEEVEGVGHETTPEMNALFHAWLDAAVCGIVGDERGAARAEWEADVLRGRAAADGGFLWDGGPPPDAPPADAGFDAGVRARFRGRRRAPDAGGSLASPLE